MTWEYLLVLNLYFRHRPVVEIFPKADLFETKSGVFEPTGGIEPSTFALQKRCSTN